MKNLLSFLIIIICIPALSFAESKEKDEDKFKKERMFTEGSGKKFETNKVRSFNIKNAMDGGVKIYLVDVRDQKSFYKGRIRGAINIQPEDFTERSLRKIFPNKRVHIVIYGHDREDETSGQLAVDIKKMGYENVFHYQNGYDEWEQREYAIDSK